MAALADEVLKCQLTWLLDNLWQVSPNVLPDGHFPVYGIIAKFVEKKLFLFCSYFLWFYLLVNCAEGYIQYSWVSYHWGLVIGLSADLYHLSCVIHNLRTEVVLCGFFCGSMRQQRLSTFARFMFGPNYCSASGTDLHTFWVHWISLSTIMFGLSSI